MSKICLILCLLLLLTACKEEPPVIPEPVPEPVPVVEAPPKPEPAPVVPKPEEPLPEPEAGDAVTVDGQLLESGSVIFADQHYVRLDELTEALDAEQAGNVFVWDGHPVFLSGDTCYVDGEAHALTGHAMLVDDVTYVPVESVCQALDIGFYDDSEEDHLYFTPGAGEWEIPTGYYVPTLMYHAVDDETWGYSELFVRPSDMEAQLQYLQDNGYTTIFFSDLANLDEIEKPVLLTFDDGYVDNYTKLYPLLQKYNAKATIFVITNSIKDHPKYMKPEQIKEMSDSGLVEIQSHTVSHPFLDTLTVEEQEYQLTQAKLEILRMTGREPYVFSYPSGRFTHETLELVKQHYRAAVRMDGNEYHTEQSPYEILRWYVYRYLDLYTFGDMLEPAWQKYD